MTSPITLNDAIKAALDYRLNNLHTCLPAEIISYDFTTQKALVQPLLNKVWASGSNSTPTNGQSANMLSTPMPVLDNVPVVFPRSGGAGLTFPVNSGDTCLLVFCERSLDLWLTVGGQVNPDDNRKFDLSDAIAIMGIFPFNESSTAENNNDVLLTYADSKIRIKQNGAILIETASTVAIGTSTNELLKIISDLLNSLENSVTTAVGTPIQGALPALIYSNLKAQVEAIRGTIT